METTREEDTDMSSHPNESTNETHNENNNSETIADNIEDNNQGNNENNDNQNNEEDNEESDEDETDIFTLMYGEEEDLDDESDDGDGNQLNALNAETTNNINLTANQNKRPSDFGNSSSKRRSDESDCFQSKRIKSEPSGDSAEQNARQMTTTIEEVPNEEEPPPEVPKNTFEFMSYILDLNANDLEANQSEKFSMSRNYQNISQMLRFSDLNVFQNAFIPYILSDLWRKLNYHYNHRHKNCGNIMNLKYFLSILTKTKSTKMKNGLDMKCISVVRPKEGPVFKFGQLITIQTAVQPKPNSTTHIINRRRYFGYIISHSIRETNVNNQSEVNHLRLLNESKNDSVIVEEITFMTKYSDELYLRNDALIVAEPIVSVHNNYMEARTVYKFKDFLIWPQIFDPIFSSKPSGFSVSVNENRFDRTQVEMIQIALDVVANSSLSNSCFLAINSSKNSVKTPILMEIIRQIIGCKEFAEFTTIKILFCSPEYNTLKNVNELLKSRKIKTFFIENESEETLKEFAVKRIESLMNKDKEPQQKDLLEQCLQYFESGSELSAECILFKYKLLCRLRHELLTTSSVIMGRIEDLCNDISFYTYFTDPKHSITCCVIDDSMSISEPQLYSLFPFRINKFLFCGDFGSKGNGTDICRSYGLSRSFFQRYYSLYLQSNDNNQTTVFDV